MTLLSGGGLYYNQESFGGEHEWENDMDVNVAALFEGDFLRRSSFLGNLKASYKKLDFRRTPTWIKYFIVF